MVANFFGDPDRVRRHKEVKFNQDLEALVSEMQRRKFHVISTTKHFVPAPPKKTPKNPPKNPPPLEAPRSAIVNVFVKGAEEWNGKFMEFIKTTTYDPALGGYPPPAASSSTGAVRNTTRHSTPTLLLTILHEILLPTTTSLMCTAVRSQGSQVH
jgi:hypothetical protein